MSKFFSSPFTTRPMRTPDLMRIVILCCLPGILVQAYFFGWGNLIQIVLAAATAWLCEVSIMLLRNRPALRIASDLSAVLTGVLLGIALPPFLPWWMTVLATLFAIAIVKHLYGGLGHNIFNPAMAGYVLLLVAFPVAMTTWQPPIEQAIEPMGLLDSLQLIFSGFSSGGFDAQQARLTFDGITAATPLDTLRTDLRAGLPLEQILAKKSFGLFAGAGWEWLNLSFLLGGLYLARKRLIAWQIPVGLLSALLFCSLLGYLVNPTAAVSPLLHLFSGATMLGAFFIATDPVSASTTRNGRLLYGALIGVLIYCIRTWGSYPDAVAFAILLANMMVSFIDHYTKPRTYGHKGRRA